MNLKIKCITVCDCTLTLIAILLQIRNETNEKMAQCSIDVK